jgi:hypothetical protein
MKFLRKYKKNFIYASQQTIKFLGQHPQELFITLILLVIGFIMHYYFEARQKFEEEVVTFFLYTLAPVLILTLLIFLWNLFRSDLKLRLENQNNGSLRANPKLYEYLEYIGVLWEYLKNYNYEKEFQERNPSTNFFLEQLFLASHTSETQAFAEIKKLKTRSFSNEELQALLEKLLSNFKFWNSSKFQMLKSAAPIFEIKPIFKDSDGFKKKEKDIKYTIDRISELLGMS